jgi:uncharacterized membrane protein
MNAQVLLVIAGMSVVTYATRVSGFLLGAWLPRAGRIGQGLDALPTAILTALIAPSVTAGVPEMIGGAVTAIAAFGVPMLAAIATGIGCVAMLRSLG